MADSPERPKCILLTGGGTAGHVTPNLALIPLLQSRGYELHYVGRTTGIERELVEPLGIAYHSISAGKLRRYISRENLADVFRVGKGLLDAMGVMRRVRPDAVFSKGGFVSCPVAWAAWLCRIPVVIHESDLTPGLANKLSASCAARICHSFPETARQIRKEKAVHTGLPIRASLLQGDAAEGRRICGFGDEKPVLLVLGGSLGAKAINQAIQGALSEILVEFDVCHMVGHQGLSGGDQGRSGYFVMEYANEELPHLLAASSVVLSRAGATTLFELVALRKPNLLVPLTQRASRGDQEQNARCFAEFGLSAVLSEDDISKDRLVAALLEVRNNGADQQAKMAAFELNDAAERVIEVIEQVSSTR